MKTTDCRKQFNDWAEAIGMNNDEANYAWFGWRAAWSRRQPEASLAQGYQHRSGSSESMELLKLLGYVNAMVGYCQSLKPGTVIREEYVKRMNDYYIPNTLKAAQLIAELLDSSQRDRESEGLTEAERQEAIAVIQDAIRTAPPERRVEERELRQRGDGPIEVLRERISFQSTPGTQAKAGLSALAECFDIRRRP